jgi:hypothetical protein
LLPHYTPSDELVIHDQVENYREGLATPRLDGAVMPAYPLLLPVVATPVRAAPRPEPARTLEQHAARASALRLDIRIALMLISFLVVPGTWWLARRLLEPGWALFAAALAATSFLSISNSQMGRPHAPLTALSVLSVVASMRLLRERTVTAYLVAGLAASLAIGCLHNGVVVLLPLGLAWVLAWKREPRAPRWWIVVVVLMLAATVRWLYPFQFESWTEAEGPSSDLNVSGHLVWASDFDGSGFLRVLATFYSYDPLILLVGAAGLVILLVRCGRFAELDPVRRGDLTLVLAYALPYVLVLGVYARTAERFVLPLVPYAALVGAYGASRVVGALARRPRAAVAGALVLLAFPTYVAFHLGRVRAADDTLTEAADWIRAHLDADTDRLFVLPYFTLPLIYGEESLAHNWAHSPKTKWIEYLVDCDPRALAGEPRFEVFHPRKQGTEEDLGDDPLAWFRAQGIDTVVVQHVRPSFRLKVLPDTHAALREEARLGARFTPLRDDDGGPARLDYNYSRPVLKRPFVWHLLQSRRMGPTVEIYRLGPTRGS